MRVQFLALSFLVMPFLATTFGFAHAQHEVFVCQKSDGTREYKNTGDFSGCKKVDLQGVSMIASPPARQPARAVKAVSTPSNFPRVDGNTQKARDTDRMQILVDELKDEEGKLANLRQAFNNGQPARRGDETNEDTYRERVANLRDDLNRTEKNIEALKREIGKLK